MVNNKKNKRKKKEKYRTKEERKYEVKKVIEQMNECYNLNEAIPAISILFEKMKTFVDTGNNMSGKIPYPVDNRIIDYIFSNNRNVKPCINVKLLVADRSKVKEIIKQ